MRHPCAPPLFWSLCLLIACGWTVRADERDDFFEGRIRPVLVGTCFRCHGGAKTSGALRLDSREALLKGGESGPAIVSGNPRQSLLVQVIEHREGVAAMPPEKGKALRPDQIADFSAWIQGGAAWPARSAKFATSRHWAFEPVRTVTPPVVQDKSWVKTSVDAFIRAKQELAGVHPAPLGDKGTLLRRATLDLTGLPPTPAEAEAFLRDSSPGAFASVVDRLLRSPAYGERWGRHWLDVARYADTAGETADYPVPTAWRYRNYVIHAFNTDKPYDAFVREQIAGDILAHEGPPELFAERVTATGYLALSRRFGFDSENYHHLTIQDSIDTLGQTVLGLSLGCARCHDHKFDPVSMRDYYALYGIFDSSRYAFPGSEQKNRVRSMVPLVPPAESGPKWLAFETQISTLAGQLAANKQPMPTTVLRSLNDIDGDFELQAAAAGGSNGVLVSPWVYEGKIAVTGSAQSPFRNIYPQGRFGMSVSAGAGHYRVMQALPGNTAGAQSGPLYVNLDFRVAAAAPGVRGMHRFALGSMGNAGPAVELLFATDSLSIRIGQVIEKLGSLKPDQWHNLQLILDRKSRTVSGRFGMPGKTSGFSGKPFSPVAPDTINHLELGSLDQPGSTTPTIEFDNLAVRATPIAPVSTEPPIPASKPMEGKDSNPAALAAELQALTGIDGDLELQARETPPASPWNPGPNSAVTLKVASQSPFRNIYPEGELGIHLPNRAEYDGFGLTLPPVSPDKAGRLHVGFDFRCGDQALGGNGSWRYYIGHGAGGSAAIELFFNGSTFFRRASDAREVVSTLVPGEWYQVQLALDLKARTYTGLLVNRGGKTPFSGQVASGWDGAIDYLFIDSYGHIGGVRPALDADNFFVGAKPLPPLDGPAVAGVPSLTRRTQAAGLRRKIAALQSNAEGATQEMNTLLAEGPFAMAYGMVEGTPHNARLQLRGEPDQPGAEVPRGFVQVLGGGPLPTGAPGSGRLELARWITRTDNPLTARVMANRIWQYHFGRGLVKTPNDFGLRGLPPTDPALLDHLASQFIQSGWSVKAMHRLIMLSATYQQASVAHSGDWYAGFSRRRLEAEEIRDAILAVSGELDPIPGREHPFPSPVSWGFSQHGPFNAVYEHDKRSVYLMTQRLKRHPFLALFDGADPNASTPERLGTTVPTQALFFLNDPFVHTKAEKWAGRLQTSSPVEARQVEQAWLGALGRLPTVAEQAEAAGFLAAYRTELVSSRRDNPGKLDLAAYLRSLFGSNEFLHVD